MIEFVRVAGLSELLGKRLRALREAGGMSRARAAETAGLTEELWRRMESGHIMPSIPTLAVAADAIDVSIVDLVEPVDEFVRQVNESLAQEAPPAPAPLRAVLKRRPTAKRRHSGPALHTPLTPAQKRTLEFIRAFIARHAFAPTNREICDHFGWTSTNACAEILAILEAKGAIKRTPGHARTIVVVDRDPSTPPTVGTDEPRRSESRGVARG